MKDEAYGLSKEAFEAAWPKLDVDREFRLTDVDREFRPRIGMVERYSEAFFRTRSYSRLIHGRIEDDIRSGLNQLVGEKLDPSNLKTVLLPFFSELCEISSMSNLYDITFPIEMNIEGHEFKIGKDGRIEFIIKPQIQYINLNITITKNEE